jgi:hypothetical protein
LCIGTANLQVLLCMLNAVSWLWVHVGHKLVCMPVRRHICCCLQVSKETLDSSVVNTAAAGAEAAALPHSQQQDVQQQHIQQQQPQVAQADGSPAQPATAVVNDVLADSGQGMPCCCAGAQAAGGDMPLLLPRQGERVSLTIRRVLKVHKALGILGKR